MTYKEIWVDRDGHRIYAREYPGAEPAIVLIHGFPDDLHLYDRRVPELAGRRVVSFDLLGWGASDEPRRYPYTACSCWTAPATTCNSTNHDRSPG